MLWTEDEAKTKWCPMTRVGEQAAGAAENRPDGSFNCIASGCMAWRQGSAMIGKILERQTAEPGSTRPAGFNGYLPSATASESGEWIRREETPRGFCGLANNPEA